MNAPKPFDKSRFERPDSLDKNGMWTLVKIMSKSQEELIAQIEAKNERIRELEMRVEILEGINSAQADRLEEHGITLPKETFNVSK